MEEYNTDYCYSCVHYETDTDYCLTYGQYRRNIVCCEHKYEVGQEDYYERSQK